MASQGACHRGELVRANARTNTGPIVAATDYVRSLPEMVRAFVPAGRRYVTLGTDGFGRSDSRAALRAHFEVGAQAIVQASLCASSEGLRQEALTEHRRLDGIMATASI